MNSWIYYAPLIDSEPYLDFFVVFIILVKYNLIFLEILCAYFIIEAKDYEMV